MLRIIYNNHHQICTVIVLMSALLLSLPHSTCGRPDLARYRIARQDVPSQALLNELLAHVNDEDLYNELQKYHHDPQPNYMAKWPGLRDLLLTADYEDRALESDELLNSRFIDRLRQMSANSAAGIIDDIRDESMVAAEPLPTAAPLRNALPLAVAPAANMPFKDHGIKKNAQFRKQYMSPCHFKICNMGRKRNARNFADY